MHKADDILDVDGSRTLRQDGCFPDYLHGDFANPLHECAPCFTRHDPNLGERDVQRHRDEYGAITND